MGGGRSEHCRYAQSMQQAIDELAGQVDAPAPASLFIDAKQLKTGLSGTADQTSAGRLVRTTIPAPEDGCRPCADRSCRSDPKNMTYAPDLR
jgi:uncharacterized protein with beta-barrel porin domain